MKVEDLPRVEEALEKAKSAFQELRAAGDLLVREEITPIEIAKVISAWLGIPAETLSKSDREKLASLKDDLQEHVFGQEKAVDAVVDAIIRSRTGLSDETRPIGSFLFLGPSGVGKTWLAKCLAKLMFDDYEHMIRIDMSEYGEKHSVSRLVGAPPGYIGFEQGGQLTEAVRRRPYSIVLLDEIEKAHVEVFDVLLQVLDDGRLTDGQGNVVDFKNTVIIMTSNIGSHLLLDSLQQTGQVSDQTREAVVSLLRKKYRPEILNRIDEIAVFDPLGNDMLGKIASSCLSEIKERLAKKKLQLEWTDNLIDYVNSQEYDPSQGARGMKTFIKKTVETALASAMVAHYDCPGFRADVVDGEVKIEPLENI
jgi:ATP-dependent Clp protease ATP-binding subunit ClpB